MKNIVSRIRRIVHTESFCAAAILIGILHVAFFPCIWGNRTLLASSKDVSSVMPNGAWAGPPSAFISSRSADMGAGGFFGEPNLPLLRYQYTHEHVAPLWNPYQGYGTPLAANQQSQPFYPLTLAVLLHIGPRTYNWFLLTRLLVAGIASYFYLRLYVSFWPAITGGVTSMLAGYYLLLLTIPHLSVEVLLPAALLGSEYLLRKCSYRSLVWFAIVLLLVFLGGMPESALLLFTLLYAYLFFRIVSDVDMRAGWPRLIVRVAAATCAGLGLAAFFVLPFVELMRRSFNTHQPHNMGGAIPGLAWDAPGQWMFTYFFPLLHGPPGPQIPGLRNYVGLLSFFLAVIASAAVFRKGRGDDRSLHAITCFFLSATVLLELKRCGFPPVNAIGRLPLFQLVDITKYEEALLSVCVSILGAIGLERLLRRSLSARAQAITLAAVFLLIPLAIFFSRHALRHEFLELHLRHHYPNMALGIPAILIAGVALLLFLFWRRGSMPGMKALLGIGVAALVACEMCLNFIAPTHFWYNKLAPIAHNPFTGAPYIDVLKKLAGNDRVFARDGVLFPNWAAAFQLYDIRNLDAVYDKKYLPFVQGFFSDQKNVSFQYDLRDRFNGIGNYSLTTPLAERLLQLSSVKYVVSAVPLVAPNAMIEEMMEQNRGRLIPGKEGLITPKPFILSGEARNALGEHPPYERLPYLIHVPNETKEVFDFSYALDPAVFDKTVGDGVEFIVEVKDSSGAVTKRFSRYIDPKHNVHERHWLDGQVDLSAYRNQTIELLFTTTPGPKGNTVYDWAAWSNFHFDGHDAGQGLPFRLIYNAETSIYRYDDVLPRAAIYYRCELASSEKQVLRKLLDPSLNVFQSVILDVRALTSEQRARVEEMNREAAVPVQAASIKSYKSQDVQIEASLDRSGILVSNDTAYPGWTVSVDGHPAAWVEADYLFRGVFLSPGKHTVRFQYQPKSFSYGATISGLTAAGLLAMGIVAQLRRRAKRGQVASAALQSL